MRNFEERMQEIQKRSNARIARRRKQITALCLPLVAALCVGGVMLLPQQTAYHNENTTPTVTTVTVYSGSVTVKNGNVSVTSSGRDTVEAFQLLVSSLMPVQDSAVVVGQNDSNKNITQATTLVEKYTIILETEEGAERYQLLGKTLRNMDTDELFALTDAQRAELLKLLDII